MKITNDHLLILSIMSTGLPLVSLNWQKKKKKNRAKHVHVKLEVVDNRSAILLEAVIQP